jgi:hypothetical protein
VLSEETVAGRNNSESIAVEEVTNVGEANVLTTTWLGDTSEDERSAISLEDDDNFLVLSFTFDARLSDETMLREEITDALLDFGPWSPAVGVTTVLSIAHAGEEIADGVSE